MIASLVVAVALVAWSDVASSQTDALVKHQVKTLAISVPAGWERKVADGTERFAAPSGKAFFTVDVGAVQTAGMAPSVCLGKLQSATGGANWERLSVGSNPAARKVEIDSTSRRSTSYVGCNGKTTWSLVYTVSEAERGQFEPLVAKVIQSIAYRR